MLQVTVTNGPGAPGSAVTSESIRADVENVLRTVGYDGIATLRAIQAVKGTSHRKGIKFRGVDGKRHPPSIALVAQPGDNKTCWEWQLQFPSGTNVDRIMDSIRSRLDEDDAPVSEAKAARANGSADAPAKTPSQLASAFEVMSLLIQTARAHKEAKDTVAVLERRLSQSRSDLEEAKAMVKQLEEQVRATETELEQKRRVLNDPEAAKALEMLADLKTLT